ncbi:hypothetical protein CC86DRAFT_391737 [Ophiobolus disseminans]|uniref:Uncharacterized protein n=1 Tax=Ophiobolus disseminans TaxID=1469910 RepID=A0A6A7AA35_9PLEO|nr:hypothetical protein CC86DRAFT_391737 [Ophiobolus disseminans]
MTSLVKVRAALQAVGSDNSSLFISLIDDAKLGPYKSREALRCKFELAEAEQLSYPVRGRKQAPVSLSKVSTRELQQICLRDLPAMREYYGDRLIYFSQSGDPDELSETSPEDAGMQTITTLSGTNADRSNTIVTFPSETLNDMCSKGIDVPANVLRAAITTCTILPSDILLPLFHSNEGTTVTTLLSGSVAWIFWPPTERNMRILQTAYENYAKNFDETKMDVASSLEGGIIFLQTEGDGLRIPPFCLTMSLALETSVLASNSHVTVENFVSMLHRLPLLKAWYQTEQDGERLQSRFNASILTYLDLMLNGSPEHEDRDALKLPVTTRSALPGTLLGSLLSIWDSIKEDLAAMLGPADHVAMENIWETFLVAAKGRKCWLCNDKDVKDIRNKQKLMKAHFVEKHWAEIQVVKRVDSMVVGEEGQVHEEPTGQIEETIETDEGEDAMDVDE